MLRIFVGEGEALEVLKRAAQLVWGVDALPELARLPEGKPVFQHFPQWHFNYSHSGGTVLCALSDHPVGADVERIRPRRGGLPRYALQGERYDRFLEQGGDWTAFYTQWTEVESILKYTGEGLKGRKRAHVPPGCVITRLSGEGWRGAVCAREEGTGAEYL